MKCILIFISLFFVINANAKVRENKTDEVKTVEKPYVINYLDGSDKFLYKYTAYVYSHMEQNGSSSTLSHPVDTRRCSYSVSGYVERVGYFLTGGGQKIPYEKAKKKYTQSIREHSIPHLIDQIAGKHKTCGHYTNAFNSAKEQSKNAAIGLLVQIIEEDTIAFEEKNFIKKTFENVESIQLIEQ